MKVEGHPESVSAAAACSDVASSVYRCLLTILLYLVRYTPGTDLNMDLSQSRSIFTVLREWISCTVDT